MMSSYQDDNNHIDEEDLIDIEAELDSIALSNSVVMGYALGELMSLYLLLYSDNGPGFVEKMGMWTFVNLINFAYPAESMSMPAKMIPFFKLTAGSVSLVNTMLSFIPGLPNWGAPAMTSSLGLFAYGTKEVFFPNDYESIENAEDGLTLDSIQTGDDVEKKNINLSEDKEEPLADRARNWMPTVSEWGTSAMTRTLNFFGYSNPHDYEPIDTDRGIEVNVDPLDSIDLDAFYPPSSSPTNSKF